MSILKKLVHLENAADNFGFKWENSQQILSQIKSECGEIETHLIDITSDNKKLQEEIGDLLHAAFSLCIFCHFDPEETLIHSADKFERRLNAVKNIAAENSIHSLNGYSFDALMKLWDEAKKRVG